MISDIEGKSYKFLGNGSLKLTPAGCFFDEIRKGISWESYPRNSYFKAVCKSSVHASCKANFGNYINFFPSPLLCIYIYISKVNSLVKLNLSFVALFMFLKSTAMNQLSATTVISMITIQSLKLLLKQRYYVSKIENVKVFLVNMILTIECVKER